MFGTQSVTFRYPTSFPQFRTIVRPPTSPPPISYLSTTSQPLPTFIPNPKKEGGRQGSARPSATIASHTRRLRVSVARPSDFRSISWPPTRVLPTPPVHLSRHWPRFSPAICFSKYVCITTIEYKHHPRGTTDHADWPRRPRRTLTDHEERLTTIDFHDDYHNSAIWRCSVFEPFVILCYISLRHFLTYENIFVYTFWHMRWSVSLSGNFPLFCPMWTHCETSFSVKRRICMQILAHETIYA